MLKNLFFRSILWYNFNMIPGKYKKLIQPAVIFAFSLCLLSCASMDVMMTIQRPPNMDMTGIRRIAIMPFETSQDNSFQREVAGFLTNTAAAKIAGTGSFTIIDSAEIRRLENLKESIDNHVDALFTGQVISLNVSEGMRPGLRYNLITRSMETVMIYEREVELVFSYSIIRARDGSLIGSVTRRSTNSDSAYNWVSLRSASSLAQEIVLSRMENLPGDVAPYMVTERRTLMEDRSDRQLRSFMEGAFALVKAQNYRAALNQYMQIYNTYNNFPALYNAALLHEVMGNPDEAIRLFEMNLAETGNPRAGAEISRLNVFVQEQGVLTSSYGAESQTLRERTVNVAVSEIRKFLPAGSRIWLYNNSRLEPILANAVVADIYAGLLREGVSLVDRDSARLRAAEMELQMMGMIRDEDIVNIGNAAGANIIVEVSIEGIGGMRRLQIRMIDIETGIPIMTSDTSERWEI